MDVRIRLFHPSLISSVMINCYEGSYSLVSPGYDEESIESGNNIFLRVYQNELWLRHEDGEWYAGTGYTFYSVD